METPRRAFLKALAALIGGSAAANSAASRLESAFEKAEELAKFEAAEMLRNHTIEVMEAAGRANRINTISDRLLDASFQFAVASEQRSAVIELYGLHTFEIGDVIEFFGFDEQLYRGRVLWVSTMHETYGYDRTKIKLRKIERV